MKKKKSEYKKHHVIILIFLTIFSLIMMYPMAWMLVTSFKTNADIRANRTKFCQRSGLWKDIVQRLLKHREGNGF